MTLLWGKAIFAAENNYFERRKSGKKYGHPH